MNHDAAVALSGQIKDLRRQIEGSERLRAPGLQPFIDRWRRELQACVDAMVGEDPWIRRSLYWLQDQAPDENPRIDGNEVWVFADFWEDGRVVAEHAIFRNTACVYRIGSDGAVEDDPIYDPKGVFDRGEAEPLRPDGDGMEGWG